VVFLGDLSYTILFSSSLVFAVVFLANLSYIVVFLRDLSYTILFSSSLVFAVVFFANLS